MATTRMSLCGSAIAPSSGDGRPPTGRAAGPRRGSRTWRWGAGVIAVLFLAASSVSADMVEEAKLTASDGGSGDWYGYAVATTADTVVVGAFGDTASGQSGAGSAYVHYGGGSTWTQQAKLNASDPAEDDQFGRSVSISGNTILVGAILKDTSSLDDSGAAYVFQRSGTSWTQQAKLEAGDPDDYHYFGVSVAISGDTAIVGAYGDSPTGKALAGAAYIFTRSGTTWTQQAKLTALDAQGGEYFGYSVSISGDTAVIAAQKVNLPGGKDLAGAAYVFTRSGTSWSQQAKLTALDAATNDEFGNSVSIDGDTVLVGAEADDNAAGVDAGAAYVFTRSGTTWTQQAKLVDPNAAVGDCFGSAVAVAGDEAVVGVVCDDLTGATDAGAVTVFGRSGTTWSYQDKLIVSDAAALDYLGTAVATAGDTIVSGAAVENYTYVGSAYVHVPEPAALALLVMGACLQLVRRKK